MKYIISAATIGLALITGGAAQAADVGVSINISQPGVYGRVDIGRFPQPVLVAPRPVIITHRVVQEPVYLWVPPGHRQNWRRYCGRYEACGAPVYFVQDRWYREHVIERRHDRHDRYDRRDRYDRHDRRGRDDHPGRGRGHDKHGPKHGHD
jgi:hypothetical protein